MKDLKDEKLIWQSSNKQFLLTSHRLREMKSNVFGSSIKSIMLEELTSCQLKTVRKLNLLWRSIIYFLLINGSVLFMNKSLFQTELIQFLFDDVHIGPKTAHLILYLSIAVSLIYILLFIMSVKKVFSFYAYGLSINIELRKMSFEERDSFISLIEDTKDSRVRTLNGLK